MEIRQMRYILAVVENGGILSNAARALYISQPSLSQAIQRAEASWGIKIFDRSTIPMRLTQAGQSYVEAARAILDTQQQLRRKIEDMSDLKRGYVAIGLSQVRGTFLLPRILPVFRERYPGIEVDVQENAIPVLEDLVMKGKVDLIIINEGYPTDKPLVWEPLQEEELLLALRPDHPFVEKIVHGSEEQTRLIDLVELKEEPFILTRPGQRLYAVYEALFADAGFVPNVAMRTVNMQTARNMAAVGYGIAIIPEGVANFSEKELPVRPFSFTTPRKQRPSWDLGVFHREGRYLTRAARAFIDVAKELLAPQAFKNK